MSLILDALKKSEAERQRGQVPNLLSPLPATPQQTRIQKKTILPWLLMVIVLLLAVLLASVVYLNKPATVTDIQAPAPTVLDQAEVNKAVPEPVSIDFAQKVATTAPVNDATLTDSKFAEFYPKVVETLGITPTVFIDLIKQYTDEQFRQAIRVTHRAKIEGQIKTNISGFFVQALKNGYTNQKEERTKKEKKEAVLKEIEQQKRQLESEKQEKIYERIRTITASNPALTDEAIETLKLTDSGKRAVALAKSELNRPLGVEDFRQIKELRFLVIDTLFVKNIAQFGDIIDEYDKKLSALQSNNIF